MSDRLNLGTSDRMSAQGQGDGSVLLAFESGNRPDVIDGSVRLTKFPAELVNAMKGVLNASGEPIIEFSGESYWGRAASFVAHSAHAGLRHYCLVFVFPDPQLVGYLIHLTVEQMRDFLDMVDDLPVSHAKTD